MEKIKTDVVVVGTGAAGLYHALHLPKELQICMITKDEVDRSDSFLAQGGMCMLRDEEDYDGYFEDTMRAGHYENDPKSVEIMIRSSRQIAKELLGYGVDFERDDNGLVFTREGGHGRPRILFHEDITGKEITSTLLERVRERSNITILEHTTMIDIIENESGCAGIVAKMSDGTLREMYAKFTVLASGGLGGLYQHSTNFRHITGDALAIALCHGIEMEHIDYIQIHPTTLYSEKPGRRFLISESVRGEGAILLDKNKQRFCDELQPRDVVTAEIHKQMKKDGTPFVWLSMEKIPEEEIRSHFPNIMQQCLEEGYDPTKECIPVVPAQHYFMGGIHVDHESKTSMNRLYAVGETSCNGVHGKNRLASNSLLESMVFAERAAVQIKELLPDTDWEQIMDGSPVDEAKYKDLKGLQQHYKDVVLPEVDRDEATDDRQEDEMKDPITYRVNADRLIRMALEEDITSEDLSTNCVMPEYQKGEVQLICKQDGVIAGLGVFKRVFELLDDTVSFDMRVEDGDEVTVGQLMAVITGDIRALLSGERTALNYLQRMSGIATYTRSIAKMLEGSGTTLLDTRKTTPNMRIFEKYAVKVGGGSNHRFNLSDGVMLKDNHIGAAGSITKAVKMAKEYASFVHKIEVEVENLDMVKEAVEAGADIIMLDNMSPEQMKEAIQIIDGRALTECSGNVTKENIQNMIDVGVDYVSSGALTHSAPIMDISLKNLHAI